MISRHNVQRFRYPERFLAELIRSYVSGEFVSAIENVPMVRRALVLAVDLDGGRLENNDGLGEVVVDTPGSGNGSYRATVGVDNPPNTVRARIMTAGAAEPVRLFHGIAVFAARRHQRAAARRVPCSVTPFNLRFAHLRARPFSFRSSL